MHSCSIRLKSYLGVKTFIYVFCSLNHDFNDFTLFFKFSFRTLTTTVLQAKVEMYSKYERQKDKRSYDERMTLYTGPQYLYPAERIKPTKVLRWTEEGLPSYGDAGEEPAAPAEQPAVDGVAAAES